MALAFTGRLFNGCNSIYKHVASCTVVLDPFMQVRNYAARKGTREKARKAKAKRKVEKVVEKVGYIPSHVRKLTKLEKLRGKAQIVRPLDEHLTEPCDDVYFTKFYKWRIYTFEEAVKAHRQTHHPTMLNCPNSFINAYIELDLTGERKTKLVEEFSRIALIKHGFDHGVSRTILAFCKNSEEQQLAKDAGATEVGGIDLIKAVQGGQVFLKDYAYLLASVDILPDLLPIRGLMRRRFPSVQAGTLGPNIVELVENYVKGVTYTAKPHDLKQDYGIIDTPFGTLDMDIEKLEENFIDILKNVNEERPKREGPFITRVSLRSLPSTENFKLDLEHYLPAEKKSKTEKTEEDVDEEDDNSHAIIANA